MKNKSILTALSLCVASYLNVQSQCTSTVALGSSANMVIKSKNNGSTVVSASGDMRCTLYSELGQALQVIELRAGNEYKVELETLALGIYFLAGKNSEHHVYRKIVTNR